jgi:hypothetical protein
MFLDPVTIAAYAHGAGFSGADLPIAVAVAQAESGGHSEAHNDNAATGDDSYGLWQINMKGSLGEPRRRQFHLAQNAELYDPQINARAAYAIRKSRGSWADWSTYKSGAYKQYLGGATRAVTALQAGGSAKEIALTKNHSEIGLAAGSGVDSQQKGISLPSVSIPNPIDGITGAISAATSTLVKIAGNSVVILLVMLLVGLGFFLLTRNSPTVKAATKVATKAVL